ncbi:MAG: hypothetical protein WAU88_06875 [Candidatus Zixiibacteriota bacterium]
MRVVIRIVVFLGAVCLGGNLAEGQESLSGLTRAHVSSEAWLRHQAITAGVVSQKVDLQLFFRTPIATPADSFIIAWSHFGGYPDSLNGGRHAIPFVPSHVDSLRIRRSFGKSDTVLVAGWTRKQNRWSRQVMDTVVVARDTLRPALDIPTMEQDTIPPGKVNDLG